MSTIRVSLLVGLLPAAVATAAGAPLTVATCSPRDNNAADGVIAG